MKENTKTKKHTARNVVLWVVGIIVALVLIFCIVLFWYYPHYRSAAEPFEITEVSEAEDEGDITIMSANVRCFSLTDLGKKSWFYRADLIIKNVAAVEPDIIGFQEVTRFHYSYLNENLPGYDNVITYRDNTLFAESCPIYYRTDKFELVDKGSFWLSETPDEMSKDWDSACYRVCSYVILSVKETGQEFVVFNTHLDHVSDEARINGINVILDKISEFGDLPSMIMGDFNAFEDSETYAAATEDFYDAKYLLPGTESSCTYQNWGTELDHPCIDYFMISKKGIEVESYNVLQTTYDGVYPSDHFPIYMQFELD